MNEDPPFLILVLIGLAIGTTLGAVTGGLGGDLQIDGDPSDWAQLGMWQTLPLLLVATCLSFDRGVGLGKALLSSPVVAVRHLGAALVWLAGYFIVLPAPAILTFFLLYRNPPIKSWPPERLALLAAILVVAAWMFLLSRLRARELVDAFYDSGTRAYGLLLGAILAAIPALLVGFLIASFSGFLDDSSWNRGSASAVVGAATGAIYGASVGFLSPITTMFVDVLGQED